MSTTGEPITCYVELTAPSGELLFQRYWSLAPTEREAANDALGRFSEMKEGYRVRSVHVFIERGVTFYPQSQPRLVAAERPS